jgi:hypothetical protein
LSGRDTKEVTKIELRETGQAVAIEESHGVSTAAGDLKHDTVFRNDQIRMPQPEKRDKREMAMGGD